MSIYEVILTDGADYEQYVSVVGAFDSKEKAEEAKTQIEKMIDDRQESHCYVCISEIGTINKLNKSVLYRWNLCDEES